MSAAAVDNRLAQAENDVAFNKWFRPSRLREIATNSEIVASRIFLA